MAGKINAQKRASNEIILPTDNKTPLMPFDSSGETIESNEEHDAIVGVPVIVEPVRIAVPLVTVPVHIRHVPVAIRIAKRYANYLPYHHRSRSWLCLVSTNDCILFGMYNALITCADSLSFFTILATHTFEEPWP
jgi:hypothetical protein